MCSSDLLARALGSGGRDSGGGVPGRRLTNGLVMIQVAVSMLLLVCAGLFVQSSRNAGAIDFGFRTDDLLVLSVDPLAQGYDPEQAHALYREIADEVGALPGVRSASWAHRAPVRLGRVWNRVFTLDGGTAPEPDAARVAVNIVDPGFFDTLGIPVLQGRGFREEDGAGDRRVAVVSERAARQLWPGQEAVGRRIARTRGAPFEVIGVARDAHMSGLPFEQPPFVLFPFGPRFSLSATLHVHVDGPPSALLPMVTETVRRHDPTLAILEAGRMDTVVRSLGLLALARGGVAVIGSFGMLGLLLAAVGSTAWCPTRWPGAGRSSASARPSARRRPPSPGSPSAEAWSSPRSASPSAPSRPARRRRSSPASSSRSVRWTPSCSP